MALVYNGLKFYMAYSSSLHSSLTDLISPRPSSKFLEELI